VKSGPLLKTRFGLRLVAPAVALFLNACATTYQPQPLVLETDLQGVQTATIDNVTVSVAILTDDQARAHFGSDFEKNNL
jgi:hypothetical protein